MYPFWNLLELRMMEVVMTTGTIRCAELQSNRHHQRMKTQLFRGRMSLQLPNQQSTEGTITEPITCANFMMQWMYGFYSLKNSLTLMPLILVGDEMAVGCCWDSRWCSAFVFCFRAVCHCRQLSLHSRKLDTSWVLVTVKPWLFRH